ncbi:MAG: hypothetical protein QW767_06055 [Thermoprotei archaeon]
MSRHSGILVSSVIMAVAVAGGVPATALYEMSKGLSPLVGTLLAFFALVAGSVLGIVGLGVSSEREGHDDDFEKLQMFRAANRALVEEFDDMIPILKDIRDYLVKGGGDM